MATKKQTQSSKQSDSAFLVKLLFFMVIGTLWLKVSSGDNLNVPLPIGLATGLAFASHDHFQIDRKIEYAVLLIAMLIGYVLPFGLYISL